MQADNQRASPIAPMEARGSLRNHNRNNSATGWGTRAPGWEGPEHPVTIETRCTRAEYPDSGAARAHRPARAVVQQKEGRALRATTHGRLSTVRENAGYICR